MLFFAGKAMAELGLVDQAQEIENKIAALAPEDARKYALQAKIHLAKREYPAALKYYEQGIYVAVDFINKKRKEEVRENDSEFIPAPSLQELEEANDRGERDHLPELLLAKVDALSGMDRYEEALKTINKSMSYYPLEPIFFNYKAALLLK